jgi:putative transposase
LNAVRAEMPAYATIHSPVPHDVLARLDKTSRALLRRLKAGEQAGFPRYQSRDRWHSFTSQAFGAGATLDTGFLVLSKIVRIVIRWSRPLEGTRKTVTISREVDGRSVCFSCVNMPVQAVPSIGQETGIDLGIEAFATRSAGVRIFSPSSYRRAQWARKTAQRRVSRRKKGSARRKKAVVLLAKAQQRVRRQRQGFHHQVALRLIHSNEVSSHAHVQVRSMVQNHYLAKRIADAVWSAFLSFPNDMAACAGRSVVAVPRAGRPAPVSVIHCFRWGQAVAARFALNGWVCGTLCNEGQSVSFNDLPLRRRRRTAASFEVVEKTGYDPHHLVATAYLRQRLNVDEESPMKEPCASLLQSLLTTAEAKDG